MNSLYLFLVAFGALGFTAMVMLGFFHGGNSHASGHGGHANTGHAGSHHGGIHHGGGHHVGHHGHSLNFKALKSRAWFAISPIDIFALALGAGATGVFLNDRVAAQYMIVTIIFGGLVFLLAIVKPLMGLMLRFASTPSDGLESMVAKTGEAASKFDPEGRGLVKLTLDGQVVQLLGHLDASDVAAGVTVAHGDQLLIVEVDAVRNRCRVIKETSD